MWRQRSRFSGDPESDQSISDEEDLDGGWPANCISLAGSTKEEGLQLPLQLETLKGSHELNSRRSPSKAGIEKQIGSWNNGSADASSTRKAPMCNSDEEIVSDDDETGVLSNVSIAARAQKFSNVNLHAFGNENKDRQESKGWSAVTKEAELFHLSENASTSYFTHSGSSRNCKGVKGKSKPKFSFHSWPNDRGQTCLFVPENEKDVQPFVSEMIERFKNAERKSLEDLCPEHIEDSPEQKEKESRVLPAEVEALRPAFVEHSMAELLDGLQDNKYSHKGKQEKFVAKKSISPFVTSGCKNSSELLDVESSSDEEIQFQCPKLEIPEMKKETMADRFQEIVGATSLNNEEAIYRVLNQSGKGLYGKLQRVMQIQKERESEFLKKLQRGAGSNHELGCIDVEILSKYLDGRMTVCQCSIRKDTKEHQQPEVPETAQDDSDKRIVIFNPRICSSVNLEVGNVICVHPPWKEVPAVENGKSIILSMYHFQI